MRIIHTPIPVTILGLVALAWQPANSGQADQQQSAAETTGLAQGNCIPVSLAHFHVHPGEWNNRPVTNGCPARMYRETTSIAVHAREPREELFQILEAIDPLATAVNPWPTDQNDTGVRAYALIFHPENLSDRSDNDRTILETQIQTRVEEHDISRTGIAVSRSGMSHDLDRFGFNPDDDVVIVLSNCRIVQATVRLRWDDITEERVSEIVSEVQRALVNGEE